MPQNKLVQRTICGALSVALVVVLLPAYLHIAQTQSVKNHNMRYTDQSAYMDAAIQAYETRFAYTGDRNRMPLYPFLQALFYSPDMSMEGFFQHGKRINVVLSIICIAVLSAVFVKRFSKLYATYSMLLIALIVFAIKSPFFQAELLFYTLFGLTFVLSIDVIKAPSRYKTITLGVMFALCQYTKASAMPALFIFASSYSVLLLARLRRHDLNPDSFKRLLFSASAPIVVFLLLLSPYLLESKANYGSYFYNVNTTFYLWYDSWDEAKAGTRAAGDHEGWPDLPDEEIPSLQKYLDEHTAQGILQRLRDGVATIFKSACQIDGPFKYAYGYCSQVGLGLLALAGSIALIVKRSRLRLSESSLQIALYASVFFSVYFVAFAWYMPIIIRGARTVLSLLIPLLWITGLAVHHPRIQRLRIKIGGRDIGIFNLVYSLMMLTLCTAIYRMITVGAATYWAGP